MRTRGLRERDALRDTSLGTTNNSPGVFVAPFPPIAIAAAVYIVGREPTEFVGSSLFPAAPGKFASSAITLRRMRDASFSRFHFGPFVAQDDDARPAVPRDTRFRGKRVGFSE